MGADPTVALLHEGGLSAWVFLLISDRSPSPENRQRSDADPIAPPPAGPIKEPLLFATPAAPILDDEWVRIDDNWEPCAFSLDGHQLGMRRADAPTTWLELTDVTILVGHQLDGELAELEILARDGQTIAARLRPSVAESVLARAWESGATISGNAPDAAAIAGTAPRRRQNF
jgi:hypothetical protein